MTSALPPRTAVDEDAYARVLALLDGGGVLTLTGAGMSTASGIPDYRGPDGTRRVQPMQHQEFVGSTEARRRYWARSHAGWSRFSAARPNVAHVALAQLQRARLVSGIVTQNVDGLHQRAGATDVVELHGSLARVRCLTCDETYDRDVVQDWIERANPELVAVAEQIRPDGDVVLSEEAVAGFRVVTCLICGADLLKPDVVFFGGSVDKELVADVFGRLERTRGLLVLGSSLQVMSGYRFVRRASALGLPVAVVTRGTTRGDEQADIRVDALLGDVLPRLVDDLT